MKLFELRRNLKDIASEIGQFEPTEVDYIVASVLGESVTKLPLIDEIDRRDEKRVNKIFVKRLKGVPLDKIVKSKCFFGRDFCVNKHVLSPRPETELLVEKAVSYIRQFGYKSVLDLCTGSGCIGITVNLETGTKVVASDISSSALRVARRNGKRLGARVEFVKSNMFDKIKGEFDLILSNPPYIPTGEVLGLDSEVKDNDPRISLDGGADGLDYYRIIADKASEHLTSGGIIMLEIGENQADEIRKIFNEYTYVESVFDYNGTERVLIFRRK